MSTPDREYSVVNKVKTKLSCIVWDVIDLWNLVNANKRDIKLNKDSNLKHKG